MLRRTEGIVLRTIPYGEADLIVTYLTQDYGILKTFAKSPRKTKSRFGSSLEPLTHAKIAFWGKEEASLPRLTQSDILHPFHGLRNGLHCFLKVSELLEVTLAILPEGDVSRNVFSLLLTTLGALEGNCDSGLSFIHYKVRLLELAGYLPRLHNCGRCGSAGSAFYLSHGTVLCGRCAGGNERGVSLSGAAVSLFESLRTWDIGKLHRIRPAEWLVSELARLLDEHVKFVTGRGMKSRAFRPS